jgi:hypothetical protein
VVHLLKLPLLELLLHLQKVNQFIAEVVSY